MASGFSLCAPTPGSFATLAVIRRVSSAWAILLKASFAQCAAKVLNEVASCPQIGKAPPTISLIVLSDPTPVSRLNVSRIMKLHNSAAQLDFQSAVGDSKLDEIGISFLVG